MVRMKRESSSQGPRGEMLKRVVRRALEARRNSRDGELSVTTPTKTPEKAKPIVAPAGGGIAARIAAGNTGTPLPTISATSGANVHRNEKIHIAEDGQQHWGTIDNESARSKARGEQLIIDQWECISCGTCVENTDAVFLLPDEAKAVVTQQDGDMTLIQDAIDACPVTCIHWTDEPTTFEQLNDADGKPL
jgi:ferredoxin